MRGQGFHWFKLREVYERVRKSVISFCKKAQDWLTDAFRMAMKKSRKSSGDLLIVKGQRIYSVKRDSKF